MSWELLPREIKSIIIQMTREMNEVLEFERFMYLIFANLCYN